MSVVFVKVTNEMKCKTNKLRKQNKNTSVCGEINPNTTGCEQQQQQQNAAKGTVEKCASEIKKNIYMS